MSTTIVISERTKAALVAREFVPDISGLPARTVDAGAAVVWTRLTDAGFDCHRLIGEEVVMVGVNPRDINNDTLDIAVQAALIAR